MHQAKEMFSLIIILLSLITAISGICHLCHWGQWSSWSSCSRTCGGSGRQSRDRDLCCMLSWIADDTCERHCKKDYHGYHESRYCNNLLDCFNGGTLKLTGYGCDCSKWNYGFCCENPLPGCDPLPKDLIFILDSSASQTGDQFQTQLDFVRKFVDNINISSNKFQIAVITFSTEARVEINFDPYISKDFLLNQIKEINFHPGVTFTDKGLKEAMKLVIPRLGSERLQGMLTLTYAIVLTDGMSNKRRETRLEAMKLKRNCIKIIAIGIGKEVSHQELVDIASPGDIFSPSYVFSVGDFNALDTLLKQLVHETCKDCSSVSHLSNIVFLLDESNQMSETEFLISVDAITSIVKSSNYIGEREGPVFGLVQLRNTMKTVIELSAGQLQNNLQVKIQTLNRMQNEVCDKDEQCSGRNITSAIDHIFQNIYSVEKRQKSRKFLVVMSNGNFDNQNAVKEEMANIRKTSDVKFIVIGPGFDVNMDGLLSLAKEANHVYVVPDRNDLAKLDVLQSEFSYIFCKKT